MTKLIPARKRTRRTPEQKIADLQKKIARLEQRAKAKEHKSDPAMREVVAVARACSKAIDVAREAGNKEAAQALTAAVDTDSAIRNESGRGVLRT